jgi:exodeoxyribonuclease VII large subunit
LWAFNEEVVARAVARSKLPIISAVGHETDFTICDFVADLRAPTPSAAAELVVPNKRDLEETLHGHARHLGAALENSVLALKNRYVRASRSYVFREPHHLVRHGRQRVDTAKDKLAVLLRRAFEQRQQRVDELSVRLAHVSERQVRSASERLQRAAATLRALSPVAVLDRGYSITKAADGRIVRKPADVKRGDRLTTQVGGGAIESVVEHSAPASSIQHPEPAS